MEQLRFVTWKEDAFTVGCATIGLFTICVFYRCNQLDKHPHLAFLPLYIGTLNKAVRGASWLWKARRIGDNNDTRGNVMSFVSIVWLVYLAEHVRNPAFRVLQILQPLWSVIYLVCMTVSPNNAFIRDKIWQLCELTQSIGIVDLIALLATPRPDQTSTLLPVFVFYVLWTRAVVYTCFNFH
jgi:hypothetical protein